MVADFTRRIEMAVGDSFFQNKCKHRVTLRVEVEAYRWIASYVEVVVKTEVLWCRTRVICSQMTGQIQLM